MRPEPIRPTFRLVTVQLALPPRPSRLGLARFAAAELGIWAAVYGTYLTVRGLTIGAPRVAVAHASDVVHLERWLGIFDERALQHALSPVVEFFSAYYMLGFGPMLLVTAVWLGITHRDLYRGLRNALLVSVGIATLCYVFFPTAPPRLAGLGIHDTVGLSSHDTGSVFGVIRFNPYAAVPSMHVGWSLIVGYFGVLAARRRIVKAFFVAHPFLMALTVMSTGNHFFFDCVTGAAVAMLTLLVLERHRRRPRRPQLRVLQGGGQAIAPAEPERRAA
jgi:PAP2 superfamily